MNVPEARHSFPGSARDMRALSLAEVARVLGGELRANRVRFAPPGHSRRDRSAWIEPSRSLRDGFYVGTFAADDPLAIKEWVKNRLDFGSQQRPRQQIVAFVSPGPAGHERTARAISIWNEASNPWGTPVEDYLTRPRPNGRGVDLLLQAAGDAIRFHPECPFERSRTPAMVCLVRDLLTNEPKAIHRTALDRHGSKVTINGASRLALGTTARGAIKLVPDEEVTICLGVGEGLESTLSLRKCDEFGPSPVWSLISADGIEKLPAIAGIESLWVAVDNDVNGKGPRSARACAKRWRAAGREVFLIAPLALGADLNDLTSGVRHA